MAKRDEKRRGGKRRGRGETPEMLRLEIELADLQREIAELRNLWDRTGAQAIPPPRT